MASFASESHVGYHRRVNEDRYAEIACPLGTAYVVCDGIGGHGAGDVAAAVAIEAVQKTLQQASIGPYAPDYWLRRAIQAAHYSVLKAPQMGLGTANMGTTLVLLLLTPQGQAWWAHVGDSRLYLWRQGRLHRLTRDHSLVWWYVEAGHLTPEQSFGHPESNQLLLSIGTSRDLLLVEANTYPLEVQANDLFLLCSDGLTAYVPEERIAQILASKKTSLSEKVRQLIHAALEAGGYDNITVTLVAPASEKTKSKRQAAVSLGIGLMGLGLAALLGLGLWHFATQRAAPSPSPANLSPADSVGPKTNQDTSATGQHVNPQKPSAPPKSKADSSSKAPSRSSK